MLRDDVRHAYRGLRRTPLITATAVLTLALGVGACTAVFSVVYAILLRPLPYPESDRLVEVFEDNLKAGSPFFRVSALNYLSWAERSQRLAAIGAFRSAGLTLTDGEDPALLSGSLVTASLFPVLRLPPIVGRILQPDDEQRASARVVLLSESLWRSRFGGDRQIVGRSITLDGERHQVVGVMPRAFREVGRTQVAATADAQVRSPPRAPYASTRRWRCAPNRTDVVHWGFRESLEADRCHFSSVFSWSVSFARFNSIRSCLARLSQRAKPGQPFSDVVPTGAGLVHHLQAVDSKRLTSTTHSVGRAICTSLA